MSTESDRIKELLEQSPKPTNNDGGLIEHPDARHNEKIGSRDQFKDSVSTESQDGANKNLKPGDLSATKDEFSADTIHGLAGSNADPVINLNKILESLSGGGSNNPLENAKIAGLPDPGEKK